jgi:hypothetical protein
VDIPGIRHYRTADEFFADSEIGLVVVATHHDTHAMFAERALEMGMHGLFEFLVFPFFCLLFIYHPGWIFEQFH